MAFFHMSATLKLTALALLRITIPYCRRPPPFPPCRCIFPPDCDYLPVYVGTFDSRAR